MALAAGGALAGGIDRTGQGIGFMFEEGNVVELRFGSVNPSVSGVAAAGFGGQASGNIAKNYTQVALGYKQQINDKLSLGILFDQPFGADVAYPAGTGYPFQGATATVDSNSITAVMRYRFNDGFAVHGGLRAIRTSGKVGTLPVDVDPGVGVTFGIYNMNTDTQTDYGYLIGATYEIPDIALRAELTYNSKITHDFNLQESIAVTGVGVTNLQTQMRTVKPESVNLNFQTGIAANTLLLASARWVKWTDFDITPPGLNGASLVDYTSNTTSYSLGVGRKLTDKVSGAIELGYEKSGDEPVGNLGPTDGYRSVTLSMKYQLSDKTALSGGVRYVWAGDATTSTIGSTFSDNTATGIGLKLTHQF